MTSGLIVAASPDYGYVQPNQLTAAQPPAHV